MTIKRILTALVMLLIVAALIWFGFFRGKSHNRAERSHSIPVLVQKAQTRDVPIVLHNVGTIRAYQTVTVKPQVDGKLLKLAFDEGQEVKKGDVLAKIDPVLYQTDLNQAQAQLVMDRATLANAKQDFERFRKLAKTNYVSQQKLDQARAAVREGKARVQSDQAAITSAKTRLGYTDVVAPISGRTGIRKVDAGNILDTGDAIVVITQLQPISVLFTLPATNLGQVRAALDRGRVTLDVAGAHSNTVLDSGSLDVINNQVDTDTGTVKLKGDLPNKDEQLWPGQFVNVGLHVGTLKNATVIPLAALQQGPKGAFVYGIDDDSKAVMKPVDVARQNEHWVVVKKGVKPGDTVITAGFGQLSDGTKVRISGKQDAALSGQSPQDTGAASADGPASSEDHRE